MAKSKQICPCNPQKSYSSCCEPYHNGEKIALTAELLMRSRYSAYALNQVDYLQLTWHSSTRPDSTALTDNPLKWIELIIHKTFTNKVNEAFVEFTAKYKSTNGKAEKMHETSRFIQEDQRWFYIDGVVD